MEKNHFVSVAGLITNDEKQVLLIKSPHRGWEFPGGMVEPGETLQEALKREIQEESGVNVEITAFVGICKNIKSDIVNIDFCCKYVSGELATSDESLDVGWFSMEEVVGMMENPLYEKRMKNMISHNNHMSCFAFSKDPFKILADDEYPIGL